MTPLEHEHRTIQNLIAAVKQLATVRPAGKASLMSRIEQLEQEAAVTYDRLLEQEGQYRARMN